MDTIVWLAMGYQFNKKTSLASFFFYFLLYSYEPQLFHRDVVDLDDFNAWVQTCEHCLTLFKKVIPMPMQILAIGSKRDVMSECVYLGLRTIVLLRSFCQKTYFS